MDALDPEKFPTLIDVAKSDKGSGYDVISEAIYSHAEINLFPASTQTECHLDVTVITSLPTGNSFRLPNSGIQPSKTNLENKRFDMALVNRRVEVDKAGVYDRAKDKARLLVTQSEPQMAKAISDVCFQILYGKLKDKNFGFPGLIAQANTDNQHAVDAGGTAGLSTVLFLDIRPVSMEIVFGADATLTMRDDWKEETITVGEKMDRLTGLTNEITGWVGARLLNRNRMVMIRRLDNAGHKLTSDLMNQAMNLCQDTLGFTPTHILGNGRSFEQLRQSLATELVPSPKRLTDWDGVPIVRSINVSTVEETL